MYLQCLERFVFVFIPIGFLKIAVVKMLLFSGCLQNLNSFQRKLSLHECHFPFRLLTTTEMVS